MRKSSIWIVILAMIFLITACSSKTPSSTVAPSSGSQDGATLFQERCSVCHNLPTDEHMTANQWKTTVESMVARGANLSQEEQQLVIDYLAANYGK